jgi:hypothetical protein
MYLGRATHAPGPLTFWNVLASILACNVLNLEEKKWARAKKRDNENYEGRDCKRVKRCERQWINNRDCDMIVSVIY